jgi:hypothetical protein
MPFAREDQKFTLCRDFGRAPTSQPNFTNASTRMLARKHLNHFDFD